MTENSSKSMSIAVLAIAVVLALGAGIGIGYAVRGSGDDSPAASVTKSSPTEQADPTETPIPTPTAIDEPTAPAVNRLKDEVDLTALKVKVLQYREGIRDTDGYGPDPGQRWDAALVRVCNVSIDDPELVPEITQYGNWMLLDANEGSYSELDLTPSPAPRPQWDNDKKIAVGACAQGWIAFDATPATKVVGIAYSVDGIEQARWQVTGQPTRTATCGRISDDRTREAIDSVLGAPGDRVADLSGS